MQIDIYHTPQVMGILNCTPDSFYAGSRKQTDEEILGRAEQIIQEGATIIDVGACSTRPGGEVVDEQEEMRRMKNALSIITSHHPDAMLSIDTFRPSVAQMAVEEYGAGIINDVSEGNSEMYSMVARLKVPYILMSQQPDINTVLQQFDEAIKELHSLGHDEMILDPGFGFGKDVIDGNFSLLNRTAKIREVYPQLPVLAGVSRKRMIWHLLDCTPQDEAALQGTMLVNLIALQQGATILRVHDVREAVNTIKVYEKSKL